MRGTWGKCMVLDGPLSYLFLQKKGIILWVLCLHWVLGSPQDPPLLDGRLRLPIACEGLIGHSAFTEPTRTKSCARPTTHFGESRLAGAGVTSR